MTRRGWGVVVMFGTLAACQVAFAATPTLMNYQGVLTDGSGVPQVGGPFTVTFSIYDDAVATNPALWAETQSVSTDPQGHFNVMLGTVTALTHEVFSGPTRWLGVMVSPDASDMIPRTQLATSAYSFRSATVDGAAGGTINGDMTIYGGNIYLTPSWLGGDDLQGWNSVHPQLWNR